MDKLRLYNRIDELAAYTKDWDSYGAKPIDPEVIAAARRIVDWLPDAAPVDPRIVPGFEGELQFEWDNGDYSLELELESPTTIRFLRWHPTERIEDQEDECAIDDWDKIAELVRWVETSGGK